VSVLIESIATVQRVNRRDAVRIIIAALAWASAAHAKDPITKTKEVTALPEPVVPVEIRGYSNYVLLPVTAPELNVKRVFIQSVSDRLNGRVIPLLYNWNSPENIIKDKQELGISLVIDKMKGVGGGARAMWGAFAGDSDMVAHVELTERPSGKTIARQMFYAGRKAWNMQAMATEYLVFDDLVSQVVTYLTDCYALRTE
jgi:hypothetical protein